MGTVTLFKYAKLSHINYYTNGAEHVYVKIILHDLNFFYAFNIYSVIYNSHTCYIWK